MNVELRNRTDIVIYWCILHIWVFSLVYTFRKYLITCLTIAAIYCLALFLSAIERKNKELTEKEKTISRQNDVIHLLLSGWKRVPGGFTKDGHIVEFFDDGTFLDGRKINFGIQYEFTNK